jgi:hypothetical protein
MKRRACLLLCLVAVHSARTEDCIDVEGDAIIDCEDPACAAWCGTEICDNGIDDDGDSLADCDDPTCAEDPLCGATEICGNDVDDDQDGKTDCEEEDCQGRPPCLPEHCGNGIDDDGDKLADCVDPNCANDYCYCGAGASVFLRGDADDGGEVNMTDAIVILGHLFLGEKAPECLHAADADNNNLLEITDPIRILKFLFLGDVAPESPFPSCGGEYDWESEWPTCRQPNCCP